MFDLFRSREKAMKYLLTAVLSIVALSMVITLVPGITNQPMADNDPNIARVCNTNVTQGDVRTAVSNLTNNSKLPPQMVASYLPILVDQTIENVALACVAADKGLDVSDQDLADAIRATLPNLVNPANGEFDKKSYELTLSRMGYTIPMFEERMKQSLLLKRMQDLSAEGVYVAESDIKSEYERRNIKIKVQYAVIAPSTLAGEIHPSEADAQAFYKTMASQYQIPAKREYTVVYAEQDKIAGTLTLGEDKLKAEYARQSERFKVPERAKVRHILVLTQGLTSEDQKKEVLDKIKSLQKRAKAGEDFAKLASEFTEDPGSRENGGLYDFTPRNGTWVKPFEDAAFTQPIGQVGDIVTTEFGYHVIKVEAREPARLKPFEEVKGQLASELQSSQVQLAMQKAIDDARAESIKNPGQLNQIAEKYHLSIVKSLGKVPNNQPLPVLGMASELINSVFAAKLNDFTTVSQPQAGKLAFAKVDGIEPSRPAKYEEVQASVMQALSMKKAEEAAQSKVKEATAKLNGGEDFKSVAKFLNADLKTSDMVGRDGAIEGLGESVALSELFSKPVGSVMGPVSMMGSFVVAKTVDKQEPPAEDFAKARNGIAEAMKKKLGQERYILFRDSVMQSLLNKGKVKRNQKAIDAMMAGYMRNG